MAYEHTFTRHKTREVQVGTIAIGGDNPIIVQSMTTPDTHDIEATVAQIHRLEEAGCELVRVTVPKPEDAANLSVCALEQPDKSRRDKSRRAPLGLSPSNMHSIARLRVRGRVFVRRNIKFIYYLLYVGHVLG